jgi:hypothetical protein
MSSSTALTVEKQRREENQEQKLQGINETNLVVVSRPNQEG